MNSACSPRGSRLRTDANQSKIQGPVNKVCRGRHEGLDVGTKNSDFPVKGEVFPLTSPFIERSEQTALVHSSAWGWAEIVHPFHPLRGRRFEVLKKRRIAGVDALILRELERGTLSIPREWTDWADPTPYDSLTLPPNRLAADSLVELVALLEALAASRPSSLGKDTKKRIDKGDA